MEVTEEMKAEVDSAFATSTEELDELMKAVEAKIKSTLSLRKQSKCEHKHLEYEQQYIYDYINCLDCGYSWQAY